MLGGSPEPQQTLGTPSQRVRRHARLRDGVPAIADLRRAFPRRRFHHRTHGRVVLGGPIRRGSSMGSIVGPLRAAPGAHRQPRRLRYRFYDLRIRGFHLDALPLADRPRRVGGDDRRDASLYRRLRGAPRPRESAWMAFGGDEFRRHDWARHRLGDVAFRGASAGSPRRELMPSELGVCLAVAAGIAYASTRGEEKSAARSGACFGRLYDTPHATSPNSS